MTDHKSGFGRIQSKRHRISRLKQFPKHTVSSFAEPPDVSQIPPREQRCGEVEESFRMLPEFPWFKSIDLADRVAVEALIEGFPPFADFNFVELFCWNRGLKGGIANLDGNLVVRWQDCVTGELFLSFIGTNRVERTVGKLLSYAKQQGIEPRLQAIPGVVFDTGIALGADWIVEEDPINSDYLLSVPEWAEMAGSKYKNKRNGVNRLERDHAPELRQLDLSDDAVHRQMLDLCRLWADLKGRPEEETAPEFAAITSLLELARELKLDRLRAFGAYVGETLIGFSVNEILADGYALGHFAKADFRYDGVNAFVLRGAARHLRDNGVEFLNIEADLGDTGLSEAKKLCNPHGRLVKYSIVEAPIAEEMPVEFSITWDEARSA